MNFNVLVGKTLVAVSGKVGGEEAWFVASDGSEFKMFHDQDCCESVTIEDITGELNDLVGSPIVQAEESSSGDPPEGAERIDSDTWTFYRISTVKGTVVIRWHGVSNGWYSESVQFRQINEVA